ncbi:MAG: hypothetical protein KBH45_16550 [Verrucomicrobia bacterium]|nr:hypothetical protein [Verrucomicrobiota bacterium]
MKAKPDVKQAELNCDWTPGGERHGLSPLVAGLFLGGFRTNLNLNQTSNPPRQAETKKQHV